MSERAGQGGMLRSLGTTDRLEDVFSDEAYLAAMLRFEVALTQAQVQTGLIPADAAAAVERAAADPSAFDAATIGRRARDSGTLAIPLVDALKDRIRRDAPESLPYVHRGATSQDVTDTALVLCLQQARETLEPDHTSLLVALRQLSEAHAGTLMLARTLLQPAVPTTFGLKVAGWFSGVARAGRRMLQAFDAACVLQFGGPAGTLAALGDKGPAVAEALARALSLPLPAAPWHTQRDRFALLVTACGVYVGSLGKLARDVSLLMQGEIAEAAEPGGSSSAMPHKRNPAGCAAALAAATRMPGLVATMLAAMPQEHERGLGNWHAEGATIADAVQTTAAALLAVRRVVDTLDVDRDRMRRHLDETNGVIFAERALALLWPAIGPAAAERAVAAALASARRGDARFTDALASAEDVRDAVGAHDLEILGNPTTYAGSAEYFRRRLLEDERE